MFKYKRDSRKKIHLIKKYIKEINKRKETLNSINKFILDNSIIVNIITSKYFPQKIIGSLFEFVIDNNYRVYESDVIKFVNKYKKNNKYRFSYNEIQILNQIIMYLLISKLYDIIMLSYPNPIKENIRRNVQIYNIILTMNELYNWDIDNILLNTSDCDNLLLKIDEYKYLDSYSRNKYREKIKKNSIKEDKTEYIYAMELLRRNKKTGKSLCELLFRRINYIVVNFLLIVISIILSFVLSIICLKIIDNNLLFILFFIINYLFIYRIISRVVPKDFVPKYNLKNDYHGKKIMVFKYVLLNESTDIEKELKKLEKIYIDNKSDDIDYTLCLECNKNIKLLTKENSNLVNKAYLECRRLNNKYSREIFFIIYSGNINLYNGKNKTLDVFSKLLLHEDISLDKDNYFLGNNEYNNYYDYILSIDESINTIDINSLVNYLLHPYNKPIFKKGKLKYGYGSISLDGVNDYNESTESNNYLFDLQLYKKLELNIKKNIINSINYLRDYSIELLKKNSDNEIDIVKDIEVFKICLGKNYLNIIFRIKYFNKMFDVLRNICSFILMIYLMLNKLTIGWTLYLSIVIPCFTILPTKVFYQIYQLIYYFTQKSTNLNNKKMCFIYNYILCILIIIKIFITKKYIISSLMLLLLFMYVPILKKIVNKIRRKYYD